MMFGRKRQQPQVATESAASSTYWAPFQAIALTFGLNRTQWRQIEPHFEDMPVSGDAVADFIEAARMAGIEVDNTRW